MKYSNNLYSKFLIDTIEKHIPLPLSKISESEVVDFSLSCAMEKIESICDDIVSFHNDSSQLAINEINELRKRGEVSILDASIERFDPNAIGRLLLYLEGVVVPDPILLHPVALKRIVPGHFHSEYPYGIKKLQSDLLKSLDFYRQFYLAIREGLLLPTAWYSLVGLRDYIHNNFPVDHEAITKIEDKLSAEEKSLAKKYCKVYPVTFDEGNVTFHSFSDMPPDEVSKIGIRVEGDPEYAGVHFETYFEIVAVSNDDKKFSAVERPPGSEEVFKLWANESVFKSVYNRSIALKTDLFHASIFDCSVITPSTLNWELLRSLTNYSSNGEIIPQAALIDMKIPILEKTTVDRIVKGRRDSDSLANFRSGFRKACSSIKAELGSEHFCKCVEQIRKDFVEQGLRNLRSSYRALRFRTVADLGVATAVVSLCSAFYQLGEMAWIPSILVGLRQISSLKSSIINARDLKNNPMYMLWKVIRKPFSSG